MLLSNLCRLLTKHRAERGRRERGAPPNIDTSVQNWKRSILWGAESFIFVFQRLSPRPEVSSSSPQSESAAHQRRAQAEVAAARTVGGARWARTRTKCWSSCCAPAFHHPPRHASLRKGWGRPARVSGKTSDASQHRAPSRRR